MTSMKTARITTISSGWALAIESRRRASLCPRIQSARAVRRSRERSIRNENRAASSSSVAIIPTWTTASAVHEGAVLSCTCEPTQIHSTGTPSPTTAPTASNPSRPAVADNP